LVIEIPHYCIGLEGAVDDTQHLFIAMREFLGRVEPLGHILVATLYARYIGLGERG
jgi:hypothetical protein